MTVILVPNTRSLRSQGGFALLAVLWGIVLLFVLALIFSHSVQIEARTTLYRKQATQAYAMACGGVEAAILELAYPPATGETPSSPLWSWRRGQREGTVIFPGGKAKLQIANETGKLDLNRASVEQLSRLFEARGLESEKAQRLAAAIIDWRSPARAESEAVVQGEASTNRERDRPRHAPFESVEEVLRVAGMTRDILYGTVEVTDEGKVRPKYGVAQDLTVFSDSAQINVNYASEAVLRSVPGISWDLAQAIVQGRKQEPFKSVTEIGDRVPVSLPDQSLPFLTTSEVQTYSIASAGEPAGTLVRRSVEALVQVDAQALARYRIVAWYDESSAN